MSDEAKAVKAVADASGKAVDASRRLMDRANTFLAERGLWQPTKKIPRQIAIPLIQGGSLEKDKELQDRWARLANLGIYHAQVLETD